MLEGTRDLTATLHAICEIRDAAAGRNNSSSVLEEMANFLQELQVSPSESSLLASLARKTREDISTVTEGELERLGDIVLRLQRQGQYSSSRKQRLNSDVLWADELTPEELIDRC